MSTARKSPKIHGYCNSYFLYSFLFWVPSGVVVNFSQEKKLVQQRGFGRVSFITWVRFLEEEEKGVVSVLGFLC